MIKYMEERPTTTINAEGQKETHNRYFKYDKKSQLVTVVDLTYSTKYPLLLKQAAIKQEPLSEQHTGQLYNKAISYNEYESAVKKAINHYLRDLNYTNLVLIDTNNIDKKLNIEVLLHDDVVVTVK